MNLSDCWSYFVTLLGYCLQGNQSKPQELWWSIQCLCLASDTRFLEHIGKSARQELLIRSSVGRLIFYVPLQLSSEMITSVLITAIEFEEYLACCNVDQLGVSNGRFLV